MKIVNRFRGEGLTHYLQETKHFPMLSPERERELAVAWRERGDRQALQELVGSHLRLVVKIARGFGGYGLPDGIWVRRQVSRREQVDR